MWRLWEMKEIDLHLAAQEGHVEVVRVLVEAGAERGG
jgi:hypothetical protein